ncbi:MAG: chemotaxis protein CheR [Deltaproteobacteria bacterium]|nr:chemotaxis protein CheR [Deltaproteobacteria bacterium]
MAFTYFFRDSHTLDLTVKHMAPEVMGRSKIRIWDAGCAMGPEPFTLAILLAENLGKFAFKNLCIQATDIDESNIFGEIIATGDYPAKEVKRMPREFFRKYFRPAGKPGYFRIIDEVRKRVFFQRHNLLSLQPVGNNFSLVLCKNVLLHFQPQERVEVIRMFHQALAPGGFLATEQTQKLPGEVAHLFQQVADNAQLFRKVDDPRCN